MATKLPDIRALLAALKLAIGGGFLTRDTRLSAVPLAPANPPLPVREGPTVFNYTESAAPGDVVQVQGSFSNTAKFLLTSPAQTTPLPLVAFITYEGHTMVQLPASLALDCYRITVSDLGQVSAPFYVNRPTSLWSNCPEFYVGGTHELHGANLKIGAATPQIFLAPTDGTAAPVAATVITAGTYAPTSLYLKYTVPAGLVAGKTYHVSVANGTNNGERVSLDEPITCLPPGPDFFGVGDRIPSATKYTYGGNVYQLGPGVRDARLPPAATVAGNGTTDDTAALQAALSYAGRAVVNGVPGGVIELQAGTYLVTEVAIPSHVALKWATGALLTMPATGGNGRVVLHSRNTVRAALLNPQIANPATSSTSTADQWFPFFLAGTTEFLVVGGNLALNEGTWFNAQGTTRFYWVGGTISQGAAVNASPRRGPATFHKSQRFIVDGLTINSTIDAMDFTFGSGVVQNCLMTWDGGLGNRQGVVNHFFAIGGSVNIAVRRNTLKATYSPAYPKTLDITYHKVDGTPANDGEGIIAERPGGAETDNLCGALVLATATTATLLSVAGLTLPFPVHIQSGAARGQVRTALSASGNTLTLDRAWDLIPLPGSFYSTCPWTLDNANIEYNILHNLKRAMLFYFGTTRFLRVLHNTCLRSGAIDVAPRYARLGSAADSPIKVNAMYNTYLTDNVVDGQGDTTNGAGILYHPLDYVQALPVATLSYNAHILRNTVRSNANTQQVTIDAVLPSGIWAGVQYQSGAEHYNDQLAIPLALGMLVKDNSTTNCNYGVLTSTGTSNVLVLNQKNAGNAANVVSQTFDRAVRAAVNFVEINTVNP
ncbi:hypothetical protein GO988_04895 [Hymenobacter sp. HMF4947]|uniref:Pectate lyase superfamily protein domain-containing protein n=1 Tax=Hymenobacter ginkgonis TaxID=2682976 RepID=A0A7K1TB80_9BACT|nr:hypothetical protein [Hymenobacter ginkgonis]MVN75658.1 hypothetical protein [Hymenobacter ginkgonis]